MKRQLPGLHEATPFPDGFFLVRVTHAQYRSQADKPFVALVLQVLEPEPLRLRKISTRLYCTDKALWKLNWFLRDFGYDAELLGRDEVDERQLIGLQGVVKISHIVFDGASLLRLDGFAPAARWEELSPSNLDDLQVA